MQPQIFVVSSASLLARRCSGHVLSNGATLCRALCSVNSSCNESQGYRQTSCDIGSWTRAFFWTLPISQSRSSTAASGTSPGPFWATESLISISVPLTMSLPMGRPSTSLHYHFRILERVGLLRRAGTRPREFDLRPCRKGLRYSWLEVPQEGISPRQHLADDHKGGGAHRLVCGTGQIDVSSNRLDRMRFTGLLMA